MKWVGVSQWVRTSGCKSSLMNAEPAGQERTRVPPRQGPYGAGWSEETGRVLEPRNGESRRQPTVCTRRKAAVLGAGWRVRRTPPGSESGACLQRGHAGTWERHRSPCARPGRGARVTQGPGAVLGLPPGDEPARDTTNSGSTPGIGERATREGPREGQRAVVAAQRTGEGGDVRPTRPTGGKAPSSSASAGGRQGRDFELTNPDHGRPVDGGARVSLHG